MSEEQQNASPKAPVPDAKGRAGTTLPGRLARWVWAPVSSEGNRLVDICRASCRVVIIVGQEFVRDRIPLRASALTFTVVLAMVPTLALGTAVLKGLGFGGEIRQAAHSFIYQLESTALEVTREAPPAAELSKPPAPPAGGEEEALAPGDEEDSGNGDEEAPAASLSGHLHRVVDTIFDYVDKTNFATMGVIGILVLLFTVFSVLDSIENTFNDIWQARSGRALGKKLTDYLALLVILPLTINFGVAAMAALQSPELLASVEYWVPWLGLKVMKLLPVLVVVAAFTMLYSFLPNTRVTKTAALTGGFFGGLGWLLLQAVYFKLQIVVVRYNAIYGSFAALPLFLLWIHFSWMVFLLGAEVSFGTQIWRRYLWKKLTLTPSARLALAFEILTLAAADYRRQQLTTRDSLVWALKQPDAYVKELLDSLHRAGVLRFIPDEDCYLPSAPLAELDPVAIADLLLGEIPPTISADNPAVPALQALRRKLEGTRLGG